MIFGLLREKNKAFGEIRRRVSSYSTSEPLFLPPRNFHVSNQIRLRSLFLELRSGTRAWEDKLNELTLARVTREDLPHHVTKGARNIFRDARDLLFPRDENHHGSAREIVESDKRLTHQSLLRSCYRFGVPLPLGFHHDVQFSKKPLFNTSFECEQKGPILLTCDYANVYPNDFVRASN